MPLGLFDESSLNTNNAEEKGLLVVSDYYIRLSFQVTHEFPHDRAIHLYTFFFKKFTLNFDRFLSNASCFLKVFQVKVLKIFPDSFLNIPFSYFFFLEA